MTPPPKTRKHITLGPAEQLILLAILHRKNRATAADINAEIVHRTSIRVTLSALYSTLGRLEGKRIIESRKEKFDGRHCCQYFSLTTKGREELHKMLNLIDTMKTGLDF